MQKELQWARRVACRNSSVTSMDDDGMSIFVSAFQKWVSNLVFPPRHLRLSPQLLLLQRAYKQTPSRSSRSDLWTLINSPPLTQGLSSRMQGQPGRATWVWVMRWETFMAENGAVCEGVVVPQQVFLREILYKCLLRSLCAVRCYHFFLKS
jgi:hypothetical protein